MWYSRVVLRPGAHGPAVAALRRCLHRLGYVENRVTDAAGNMDSQYFDDTLARAVADFQASHDMTPDGVVGPATWRRLYNLPMQNGYVDGAGWTMRSRTLSPWTLSSVDTAAAHGVHVHVSVAERRLALHTWTETAAGTGQWDLLLFPIAVGRPTSPTRPGRYIVRERIHHPGRPLGTRWIRLKPDSCCIHGTDEPWTIGFAVTPGCIRMYNKDVELVFDRVPPDTPVVIE